MANLKFAIRPNIIQGANLSSTHSADNSVYIVYDNFYPVGSRVSQYKIEAELALSNVTINNDLSIEFDYGGIQAVRAVTTFTTGAVGYQIEKTLYKPDNSIAWRQTGDMGVAFDSGRVTTATQPIKHYKVPANGSITIPEVKAFRWFCTGSVSNDECEVYVGGTVTNVIPDYKPNGLRKSNSWKGIQQLNFSTYIRKSNNWTDVGTELVATAGQENKGKTRRRQGGKWKQEKPFS